MEREFVVKPIILSDEIEQCWEVANLLRPQLVKELWLSNLSGIMQHEKYKLAGVFERDTVVAFAGYREMTSLHSGRIIYVDDLSTSESYRSNGLTTQLLAFINSVALDGKMNAVVLDTGFSNVTSHKLFINHGFKLLSFHMAYHINL